jgi:DNA-binding beta-propeller fold protein YncE
MRKRVTAACFGALIAGGTSLFGAGPAGASPGSAVVGHTYVNGNTAGVNTVAGYNRHADGSLTPIAGSPFAVGGAGLGAGLGSQGAIQASADHRFLLAVDAGSNEISVLKLGAHGVPRPVGQPVPSDGVEPVSIAVNFDGLVYVANVGAGGSNYTGFRLSNTGRLTPVPDSTVAVPEGSAVGDVLFNSSGDRLAGTRDNTSLIDSFTVSSHGLLHAAVGSPFAAESLGPIGAEFRPTNPNELYVSNAHAGPNLGTVSAFKVRHNGVLRSIALSPVPDGQTAPCWVEISHDGRYLFTTNTGSGNLSTYAIQGGGALRLIGTTPFTNGTGAVDLRVSPDGSTLTVTGGRGHVLSTFAVDGSHLTELSSSPVELPADGAPTGLVVL